MPTPISLPTNYQRLDPFPLDVTSVFSSLSSLTAYADVNPTAYAGQVVAVSSINTGYIITNNKKVIAIGSGSGAYLPLSGGTIEGDISILGLNTTINPISSNFSLFNPATATGINNIKIGAFAGSEALSGSDNIMIGRGAGRGNTGSDSIIIGREASRTATTNRVIAIGHDAAREFQLGDNLNTVVGYEAANFTASAFSNTFIGFRTAWLTTSAARNVFVGANAGQNFGGEDLNAPAFGNTFIGFRAGSTNSGIKNTLIGQETVLSVPVTGSIGIGDGAAITESYQIVISAGPNTLRTRGSTFEIGTADNNDNLAVYGSISGNSNITVQSVTVPVSVITLTTNRTFVTTDTNNVFHFNTNSGPLTAIFPSGLPVGYNVAIMNIGTNKLHLSAASTSLKSIGNALNDQYTGAFVYRAGISDIYAVGGI